MKTRFKGSTLLNPVPVVLVTSRSAAGVDNVLTVAWTGSVCSNPPMLSVSIRPERLSHEFIKETGVFIVNLPPRRLVRETDFCGVKSGRTVDKLKKMNLTLEPGDHVPVGRIKECPVSLECKVTKIIPLGSHDLFLAEILGTQVEARLIDKDGKIHFESAELMHYCHGEYFPMAGKAIGCFGFSISKDKSLLRRFASPKAPPAPARPPDRLSGPPAARPAFKPSSRPHSGPPRPRPGSDRPRPGSDRPRPPKR